MTDLPLQTDFPKHDRANWHQLAETGLRGAEFESLTSRTEDGIERGPLFDRESRPDMIAALSQTDAPLLDGRPWHICAPVIDEDLAHANAQLLSDLKGGASAVYIDTSGVSRRADLKRLLEGVHLDLVPVIVAPESNAADYAAALDDLSRTPVILGLDPLGDRPDIPAAWRAFTVDAAQIHETGGTDGLELAVMAATLAEAFRLHGEITATQVSAQIAVGPDAHLNIIKLRACRRLYQTIADAYGITETRLPIHAISSLRMMQSEDAWTNMLRTMSAGFGAVVGGADYITLRPFTETPEARRLGNPTEFGHRVARNQQLLMMEESHLGQVRDAAHGSYFHERLTGDLAQTAWDKFQAIEANGGIVSYRKSGDFEADCAAAQSDRDARGEPILGVTLHASDDVPTPEVRT